MLLALDPTNGFAECSRPIEIKHKRRLKAGDLLGLRHFMETYETPRAHVVSLGELDRHGAVEKVDCFNVGRLLETGPPRE